MISDRQNIIKIASELISFRTTANNSKEIEKCFEYLDGAIDKRFKKKIFKKNGVMSVLWFSGKEWKRPDVLFCGHIDVVGVEGNLDLFKAKIKNNKLYGRGAGDMKGHIAGIIVALNQLVSGKQKPRIGLLLTSDEEIGGFNGARHVVSKGMNPRVVVVVDGAVDFNLIYSEKAPHHFTVRAKGRGGHASRAFVIENPLNKVIRFNLLARKKYNIANKQNDWNSTFEMTSIQTDNESKNVIPSEVIATFSWRWPLEKLEFNKARRNILIMIKECDCELIEEEGGGEGTLIDKKNKWLTSWKKVAEDVLGKKLKFVYSHGASDARHFYNSGEYGTKNIVITSANTGGHHSNNEWVDIESLVRLNDIILLFVTSNSSVS